MVREKIYETGFELDNDIDERCEIINKLLREWKIFNSNFHMTV